MNKLRVCYLLESCELSGGVRVVLDQARALTARGHHVKVFAHSAQNSTAATALHSVKDHAWYPYPVDVSYVDDFAASCAEFQPNAVVATFWTTVAQALVCGAPITVHLCQGCEWEFPEYADRLKSIDAAYRKPIPKLTIGHWLNAKLTARFGAEAFPIADIGQIVDTRLYRPPTRWQQLSFRRNHCPRVLVTGIFEGWVKGVAVALQAVACLREQGYELHLTRVSSHAQNAAEQGYTTIDAYHHGVHPTRMKEIYHDADIVLAPSFSAEGFGLPFAEALACGTAVVATAIPSHLSLAPNHEYAYFVPEGDKMAMATAMRDLIDNPKHRIRIARLGAKLLRNNFDASSVALRLEQALNTWLAENG